MPDDPQNAPATPPPKRLSARAMTGAPDRDMKRFHIFLIDTGWNVAVSKIVRSHLPLIYEYQSQDSLYLLTHAQSVELLKRAPELIGHDPTVVVYDLYAPSEGKHGNYRGFRLNLGRFKKADQALSRLQEFVRFINIHRTAVHLDAEVRRQLHREGLHGIVKILGEFSETSLELL
jgi:hypothetical protein